MKQARTQPCATAVPVAVGAALLQASIYDVPGGYRAVMFDRFSGVKDKVSVIGCMTLESVQTLCFIVQAGRDAFPGALAAACYSV